MNISYAGSQSVKTMSKQSIPIKNYTPSGHQLKMQDTSDS